LPSEQQVLTFIFVEPFRKRFSTFALDASSLDILQGQQSRLAGLVAPAKTASPAVAAYLLRRHSARHLQTVHLTGFLDEALRLPLTEIEKAGQPPSGGPA
jgi:hypothetical protein